MKLFIILLLLLVIGIYLSFSRKYDFLGVVISIIFGTFFIIHSFAYFTSSYSYELFIEERDAFEKTLKDFRDEGRELETATVVKSVTIWNQKLAKYKYQNKTFLLDQYIDDRIELLKPIK